MTRSLHSVENNVRVQSQDWRNDARCADPKSYPSGVVDHDLFFPVRERGLYKPVAEAAKRMCSGDGETPPCPVRNECLLMAIVNQEDHGILGGKSRRERNAFVRLWETRGGGQTLMEFIASEHAKQESDPDAEARGAKELPQGH